MRDLRTGGFTTTELVVLLLVLAVFLAGSVYLVAGGVWSLEDRQRTTARDRAEELLDRIQAVASDARQVNIDGRRELEVLVDIDGDSRTGSYSSGGVGGLERVVVRGGSKPAVLAYESGDSKPVMRPLTSGNLSVSFRYRPAPGSGEERLSGVRVVAENGARAYTRDFEFRHAPVPVIPAG